MYDMRFVDKLKYAAAAILSAGITLGLSALATLNSREVYEGLNKPFFAPPGWIFPVVWTLLFTLMAVSSYIVMSKGAPNRKKALATYFAHLPVNFLWSVIFFGMQNFMLAFLWILLLLAWVICYTCEFFKTGRLAGLLQIPYIAWVSFAAVLNSAIVLLN